MGVSNPPPEREPVFITQTDDRGLVKQVKATRTFEHQGQRYSDVVVGDVEYPLDPDKPQWSLRGVPED